MLQHEQALGQPIIDAVGRRPPDVRVRVSVSVRVRVRVSVSVRVRGTPS